MKEVENISDSIINLEESGVVKPGDKGMANFTEFNLLNSNGRIKLVELELDSMPVVEFDESDKPAIIAKPLDSIKPTVKKETSKIHKPAAK